MYSKFSLKYFFAMLTQITFLLIFFLINAYAGDNSTEKFDFLPGNIFSEGNSSFKVLAVDKGNKTAYVIQVENDLPSIVKVYKNILIGENEGDKQQEGDKKTPEGIYFTQNFIPQDKLPPNYGYGALPLNYPNFYDSILGKTGYGIWVHGVQDGVEDNSTEGCVALSNGDMEDLVSRDALNMPVIISKKLSFLDKDSYYITKNYWINYINNFTNAWENNDFEKFKQYIHTKFMKSNGEDNFKYLIKKKQLMKLYPYKKIYLDNIKVFLKDDSTALVTFKQMYCASNILVEGGKRLYIAKELDEHKIIGEIFFPYDSLDITKKMAKQFVKEWVSAWESKDIEKYKQFYDKKFASGRMDFDRWMEDKKLKFQKYNKISIGIDDVKILNISPNGVTLSFKQRFNADTYSDYGIKTIILNGCPSDFRIITENWRPL